MAMSDAERAVRTLRELRAIGVGLSLDDFGSGYSSLTRLRDLPVDELKLDRSFLRRVGEPGGPRGRARGDLAGARPRPDRRRRGRRGRRSGSPCCGTSAATLAQGFHIAPPLLPDELERWIAERPLAGPV